jgi:hypothetical protein
MMASVWVKSAVSSAHRPCPLLLPSQRIAALRWHTARPAKPRKLASRQGSGDDNGISSRGHPGHDAATRPGHSSLKSFGTSPNFFSTTASENSPTFGSPARLNATAPALAGSRDIPSARLIAATSLWHSCASLGAVPSSVRMKGEPRNRLRGWQPPQQSGHCQCVFFSLASLAGALF